MGKIWVESTLSPMARKMRDRNGRALKLIVHRFTRRFPSNPVCGWFDLSFVRLECGHECRDPSATLQDDMIATYCEQCPPEGGE